MAAPTLYLSTDASAPVLSGTADALRLLLKACLVDGYGAKANAGWAEVYNAANISCFQQGAGLGHFLRVEDSNTQLSRLRGYAAMTAHSTGTDPFPTVGQAAGEGLYMRKSTTADSTARAWMVLATNKHVYMLIQGSSTGADFASNGGMSTFGFGEILSPLLTGDTYASFIIAGTDTSTTSTTATPNRQPLQTLGIAPTGHYTCRGYTGTGSAVTFGKEAFAPVQLSTSNSGSNSNTVAFPDALSGALEMAEMAVIQGTAAAQVHRGYLPGVLAVIHPYTAFAPHQTFTGRGDYEGESIMLARIAGNGVLAFRLSAGW